MKPQMNANYSPHKLPLWVNKTSAIPRPPTWYDEVVSGGHKNFKPALSLPKGNSSNEPAELKVQNRAQLFLPRDLQFYPVGGNGTITITAIGIGLAVGHPKLKLGIQFLWSTKAAKSVHTSST